MKKTLIYLALAVTSMASVATPVLVEDSLLFSTNVSPNNPTNEAATLQSWLDLNNIDETVVFSSKDDTISDILVDGDLRGLFVGNPGPGYFVLKFGAQGDNINSYFFKNVDNLSHIVWNGTEVPISSIRGGGLSHYTTFNSSDPRVIEVSEPGTGALLALGLIAALVSRRKT